MKLAVSEYPYAGPERIPANPEQLLDELPGPTVFYRKGLDRSRRRAVVGMLHGNEPSGFRAIHRALRASSPPRVDSLFFVGAVDAARNQPRYSQRMLAGRLDLNRCFGRVAPDLDHRIAAHAVDWLTRRPLEAALDLHNNSGRNPPYAVGLRADPARLALGFYFSRLFVQADWKMGTLMEALDPHCVSVTIECGKAGEPAADAAAWFGLEQFLAADELPRAAPPEASMQVLANPVRVSLRRGLSLAFATTPQVADFVMDADVDRHNFQALAPGTRLGWAAPSAVLPVEAHETSGLEVANELFEVKNGTLITRTTLIPMMMTTVAEIAQSDCLFYAVRG